MLKWHNNGQKRLIGLLVVAIAILMSSICFASESVYVVNSYGRHSPSPHWSAVAMLNGSDLAIMKAVTVGYDAHNIAATPDGTCLWVTARGSNNISVIDPVSLKIIKDIKGDFISTPLGIAFSPDGTRAYIAFESTGQVGVFDTKTKSLLSSISVGGHPSFVVITPDGRKVYAVDYIDAKVMVVRTSDNSVVATLTFRGHKLQDAVVSPNGSTVYICNQDKNQIEVIRTKDDAALVPIPTTEIYPRGIGISPDGNYLFIGLSSGVEGVVNMLRLSDYTVVSSQKTYGSPRTIAVRPGGSRIFVADYDKDKCYAFDVSGESMVPAAVVSLNSEPGSRAAPIGLSVIEVQSAAGSKAANRTGIETNAGNLSTGTAGMKGGKTTPGFGAFYAVSALILLFGFKRLRG